MRAEGRDNMPKKSIHVGLQAHRLKDNPEEKRFAEAWRKQNDQGNVLAYLLHQGDQSGMRPSEPSERDAAVAATVVQWLGSPVEQHWLAEMGYKKNHANE
jgi:hypothetical protein